MKQIEPRDHWIFEKREAERDRAIEERESKTNNEQMLFERLSKALTNGNASTWEEIIHATESLAVHASQPDTLSSLTENKT